MTQRESKLSRNIMAALESEGAFVWKNHGSAFMMAGLPDIVGVYRGHFIGVETKLPGGADPSVVQKLVHMKIMAADGIVVVARSVEQALVVLRRVDQLLD